MIDIRPELFPILLKRFFLKRSPDFIFILESIRATDETDFFLILDMQRYRLFF